MQLLGDLIPRTLNSADTAARGMNAPVPLYWWNQEKSQYIRSNPACKGANWSNGVIGAMRKSALISNPADFQRLPRALKGQLPFFFANFFALINRLAFFAIFLR